MSTLSIGPDAHRYTWDEGWAQLPARHSATGNGRVHGLVALKDGRLVVFRQASPAVCVLAPDGTLLGEWGLGFTGAHGLSVVDADADDADLAFWLVDQESRRVVRCGLDGTEQRELAAPAPDRVPGGLYTPTWAVEHPANGDVWVGDGYGGNCVYRYDSGGDIIQVLDGTGPGEMGRFGEPHGLAISPQNELWITDRQNHRVVVYDLDGNFLRGKKDLCHSPCSFAFHDGHVYVPELFGALKIITPELELVAELGANPDVQPRPDGAWWPPVAPEGWPDLAGTAHVQAGRFNSPHGIAVSPVDGSVYVGEWIVGGRLIRLTPER